MGQFCDVTKVAITSGICIQIWLQVNIKIHRIESPLLFLATLLEPYKYFWLFFFKFDLSKAIENLFKHLILTNFNFVNFLFGYMN